MDIYKNLVKRMPNRALTTWITIQSLKELDAQVFCTCPACVKRRQMGGGSPASLR